MPRNPEYQHFLDVVAGRQTDGGTPTEETTASDQEIGWWKQHQFRRAMRHARARNAIDLELRYLANHGYIYPATPKEYIQKPTKEKKVSQ